MDKPISIRMATAADAEALLGIYAPYVTDTAITFEYEIPSVEEFARRITETLKRYPYLVALEGEEIVGYAYASSFKSRAAYNWAVETSVYLHRDCRGRGLGRSLCLALEEQLKRQNVLNLNASIACSPAEDSHLSSASEAFHTRLGYVKVAHFTKCGYKFGTWYDMIWMEKMLGEHPAEPEPFLPITLFRD